MLRHLSQRGHSGLSTTLCLSPALTSLPLRAQDVLVALVMQLLMGQEARVLALDGFWEDSLGTRYLWSSSQPLSPAT